MKEIKLNASLREDKKAKILKRDRIVPGIVYGKNKENISIQLDASELLKVYRKAGESQIISLEINGKSTEVIIHDFQKDVVKGDFMHVDFYAITKGEKVTSKISLNFTGESPAKREGAILEESLKEIEVKVLPKDLVNNINIDLSKLENIGDIIRVKDLEIDKKKFELLTNEDDIVVIAAEPAKVQIEEETEETSKENSEEKNDDQKI